MQVGNPIHLPHILLEALEDTIRLEDAERKWMVEFSKHDGIIAQWKVSMLRYLQVLQIFEMNVDS